MTHRRKDMLPSARGHRSGWAVWREGPKWRVEFNVSLRDGSIERWTGEGTVFPFSIVRLERAQREKPGTVMEAFVVE